MEQNGNKSNKKSNESMKYDTKTKIDVLQTKFKV